jgi:hypothetical protein
MLFAFFQVSFSGGADQRTHQSGGFASGNYATLLAPVAVVDKRHLAVKILAITMITGGTAGLAII